MNIRTIGIALMSAVVGALIGVFGYIWVIGGSGTPSGETVAPTLDVNAIATQSPDILMTQLANAQAEIGALQTQVSDLQAGIVPTENVVATTTVADTSAEAVTRVRALIRSVPICDCAGLSKSIITSPAIWSVPPITVVGVPCRVSCMVNVTRESRWSMR